jgi:hypothetical protein
MIPPDQRAGNFDPGPKPIVLLPSKPSSTRQEYNTFRPHSALGYRPPAPEAIEWRAPASASLHLEAVFRLT